MQYLGAGALGLALPEKIFGSEREHRTSKGKGTSLVPGNTGANGRVVVVGGGMAGATAAKYLRLWGGSGIQVTLVERNPQYTACILSNLVLNGSRSLSKQVFSYSPLTQKYGIKVLIGAVDGIDMTNRLVTGTGFSLPYDKLVLAPGIEFDPIPMTGTLAEQANILHAWKAGPQTVALRDQIAAMPSGGVFAITIPLSPFRATAAPYDRACLVADYLMHHRPGSKVVILDANAPTNPLDPYSAILAEKVNFKNAFTGMYAGIIEYHPSVVLSSVDATNLIVHTNIGDLDADVINAIPPQRAGAIIASAGLNNASGGKWAGVDVLSYQSKAALSGAEHIHILGDSISTANQPKGGHIANAEAKVCAAAIIQTLTPGGTVDQAPVTSSTVFSPITANTASWLSVVLQYDAASQAMRPFPFGSTVTEASAPSGENFEKMQGWFNNLMADTFA
jgi:NADPH-dependent 2,4-dienoyl-CoA reductase/sulfur reductase-like enzyme